MSYREELRLGPVLWRLRAGYCNPAFGSIHGDQKSWPDYSVSFWVKRDRLAGEFSQCVAKVLCYRTNAAIRRGNVVAATRTNSPDRSPARENWVNFVSP